MPRFRMHARARFTSLRPISTRDFGGFLVACSIVCSIISMEIGAILHLFYLRFHFSLLQIRQIRGYKEFFHRLRVFASSEFYHKMINDDTIY